MAGTAAASCVSAGSAGSGTRQPWSRARSVGFSKSVVPDQWRLLYSLNAVVGVIDGFRWAILGGESTRYIPGFFLSWCVSVFFLWLGIRRFRGMEKRFADLIRAEGEMAW
jgi:ABC-type polysaccharide/polyol phosphate export permease